MIKKIEALFEGDFPLCRLYVGKNLWVIEFLHDGSGFSPFIIRGQAHTTSEAIPPFSAMVGLKRAQELQKQEIIPYTISRGFKGHFRF